MYEPDDYTTASLVLWWQHLTRHRCAASFVIHTLLGGTARRSKRDEQAVSGARYTRVNTSGGRSHICWRCVYRIAQSARRDVTKANWTVCREECVCVCVFLYTPSVCQRSQGLKDKQTRLLPLMVLWCFVIIRHLLILPPHYLFLQPLFVKHIDYVGVQILMPASAL